MAEELLEAQAIEEELTGDGEPLDAGVRPLPAPVGRGELEAWRGEVRTAAIAAAGGVVAGAATVAAVRAVRSTSGARRGRRGLLRRKQERPPGVIASRSFLVDVHLLGR